MGTSLGISSLYQAYAARDSKMLSLEGCPSTAGIARSNFERLKMRNIQLRVGEFGTTLPLAIKELGAVDYVFFDGNHRKEPTLKYFEQCLTHANADSVFVFDDIYWSTEMIEAWEAIKQHPKVTLSLDLFFLGIVFFRNEQKQKEHFKLLPSRWKPFGIGLRDLLGS